HPGRQPRLRLDRRTLPRGGPRGPQRRLPPILRCLLHGRLSHLADRPRRAPQARFATDIAGQQGRLMAEDKLLEGRVALVTGASRGVGAATAQALAEAGAHVVITARKAKDLEAVEEAIHAAGGTATIAPMDLTESDSIARLANAVSERWDRLDIL